MRKWPDEVVEWMRWNTPGRTAGELAVLMNRQGFDKKYGMVFTEAAVKGAKGRYGFKSGTPRGRPKGHPTRYPDGMEEYIRGIARGREAAEIAAAVSEHFGIQFSVTQCRAYKKNHGIRSGLDCRFRKGRVPSNKGKKMGSRQYEKCRATMFRKGNVPANRMQAGELTHTTDGYLIRKVQEQGTQRERFEFVHRAVWEEHNGPVPEGKMVSFLDGNRDNCDIANLVLIGKDENMELNRSRLRSGDAGLTEAGINVARLKIASRTKLREQSADG